MSGRLDADALNKLSKHVIGACIEVHKQLGPGLLESTYEACLCRDLTLRGILFECQKSLPVEYKGVWIECGYRLDLLVQEELIVELKSVDALHPIHQAQLLTYLRLTNLQLGLLINFNVPALHRGVKRIVNNLPESSAPSAPLR